MKINNKIVTSVIEAITLVVALVLIIVLRFDISVFCDNQKVAFITIGASFAVLLLITLLSSVSGLVKFRRVVYDVLIFVGIGCVLIAAGRFALPLIDKVKVPALRTLFPAVAIVLTYLVYGRRRKLFSDAVSANSVRRSAAGQGVLRFALSVLFAALFNLVAVSCYYLLAGGPSFLCIVAAGAVSGLFLWCVVKWRMLILVVIVIYFFAAVCVLVSLISAGIPDVGAAVVITMLFSLVNASLFDVYSYLK